MFLHATASPKWKGRPTQRDDATAATIMLHPFQPMVFDIRSLSATTTHADQATADHESYCSAPPLILPPRPSRDQEVRRPRPRGETPVRSDMDGQT